MTTGDTIFSARQIDQLGMVASDLWIDQPNAMDIAHQMLATGAIDAGLYNKLCHFITEGYLITEIELGDVLIHQIQADVEDCWKTRPLALSYTSHTRGGRMQLFKDALADEDHAGVRIPDFHSHSQGALSLYLNSELFKVAEAIFGRQAVATQSLLFQYGSTQSLHRDPAFVPAHPSGHLIASWLALEDIHPDSGPLVLIPRSHRLRPY